MTNKLSKRASEALAYCAKMTRSGYQPAMFEARSPRTVRGLINKGLIKHTEFVGVYAGTGFWRLEATPAGLALDAEITAEKSSEDERK